LLFNHGHNQAFWYLIHVERQKEMVAVYALTSQMTPMKTIRTMLVSAIYRQIGSYLGLYDITGQTQYTYIVVKYKINLHSQEDIPVSKARTNKLYFFRQFTYIVYLLATS
jgi:hypothetical protein